MCNTWIPVPQVTALRIRACLSLDVSYVCMYWKFPRILIENTQSKSDWLFNAQSRVLQADWLMILEYNEKEFWSITTPSLIHD